MDSLKTGSGRRRWTSRQRHRLLVRFHQSQLTQRAFAARHGLGLSTLGKWLRVAGQATLPLVKFQEVVLPHTAALRGGGGQPARLDRAPAKQFRSSDLAPTVAGAAMLSVSGTTRVLVATSPVDLRGSFNRLYGLVVEQLKADPLSGNLFLFINTSVP